VERRQLVIAKKSRMWIMTQQVLFRIALSQLESSLSGTMLWMNDSEVLDEKGLTLEHCKIGVGW